MRLSCFLLLFLLLLLCPWFWDCLWVEIFLNHPHQRGFATAPRCLDTNCQWRFGLLMHHEFGERIRIGSVSQLVVSRPEIGCDVRGGALCLRNFSRYREGS